VLFLNQHRDVFISPKFGDAYVFQAVDLDNGLPESFEVQPEYLYQTSDTRYQAIWLNEMPVGEAAYLAEQKRLSRLYNSDRCIIRTRYVARIPFSYSFKKQFQLRGV